MPPTVIARPRPGDYSPYYDRYLAALPEGEVLSLLELGLEKLEILLGELTEAQAEYRYATDKWSIKEVVLHMIDTERVFAYRALRFSRNDATPLPGFEQDDYVREGNAAERTLRDLLQEYRTVRAATLTLFRGMNDAMLARRGVANEAAMTVQAVPWIVAGHERHHVAILKERYLAGAHDG
jgi:uncharacterized damage-inducible protein DinB